MVRFHMVRFHMVRSHMIHFLFTQTTLVFLLAALQAFGVAAQSNHGVTYNGNGSTGGSVPVDATPYAPGAIATVLGNTGALVNPGFQFAGWNSTATGSGTGFAAGATFTMGTANVTLYALWVILCSPGSQNADCVPQTPITVQIINDSGMPDSQVMLLLSGKDLVLGNADGTQSYYPFSVNGIANINITGASPAATPSSPLSCQPVTAACPGLARAVATSGAPLTLNSPYSGRQNLPVYQFTMSTVASGTLFVSNPSPNWPSGVVTPPTPTATSALRFQPLEFSYANGIVSNGDLTTIDFFGMPFELETYAAKDTNFRAPLDRVTYYTSTPSLLNAFIAVNANLSSAFVRTDGLPYDSTHPLLNFARIVGPNQAAAATSAIAYPASRPAGWPRSRAWPPTQGSGSPWPYPGFAAYLDGLAANNYTFTEQDNAPISGFQFQYQGTVTKMYALDPVTQKPTTASCLDPALAVDGWLIKLKGSTTTTTAPLPANADICIPLPARGSSTAGNQYNSGDFVIYGAPQNCQTMGISDGSGGLYPCSATNVGSFTNSLYGWIQADVLAALSFGYMGGKRDAANKGQGRSGDWYGLPPIAYPFGAARSTNDGYYNIWAALFYNSSDAYGFAFSDRNGRPSPDIAFPIGGVLRLWILPDQRLDAPMVQVTSVATGSVTLSWPVVAAADHYSVTWSPPFATASVTVAQPLGVGLVTQTINVPDSGTTYTFTVRAISADLSQSSAGLPVYTTTQGPQPDPKSGNAAFNFSLDWTPPASLATVPDLRVSNVKAAYAVTSGVVTYTINGLPMKVGPPASSAPLTVTPAASYAAVSLAETIVPSTISPTGSASLTLTLTNPSANPVPLPRGYSVPLPAGIAATLPTPGPTACPGAVVNLVNGTSVIAIGATPLAPGSSCTIVASLSSSTPGTYLVATPDLQNGPAAAPVTLALGAVAPLTITGGKAARVSQSIVPSTIPSGGSAVLTINMANPTSAALTLQQKFVDELPTGVTVSTLQAGTTPCPGVAVDPTGAILSMPAGTTIPVGGCAIVATITSTSPGSVTNTTGPLLTSAADYPVHSFPLELRMSAGDPKAPGMLLWGANLYLTFLGTSWEYSVGPCLPTDNCIGGLPTPAPGTVAFNTVSAPNFLERQSPGAGLSIAGGTMPIGPPFGTAVPNVGVSFTPVADKRIAPVRFPAPVSSVRKGPPARTPIAVFAEREFADQDAE